jgi:oligopeptide/dipeptide ABC transporter ATP-binding protein
MKSLIRIEHLRVHFFLDAGIIRAADDVDLALSRGEIIGIVGESGAGKSVTALSIVKLIRPPGRLVSGEIWLGDENIAQLDFDAMRRVRGKRIGMIFQDPMSSLNPRLRVGDQIAEAVWLHRLGGQRESLPKRLLGYYKRRQAAREIAIDNMNMVGIPDARRRYGCYPHEFSGGMRQRAMIAMALAAQPDLLIADEPTTALDVTVQAQILNLLCELNRKLGMSILIITHDMAVISEVCQRVYVMYAGKVQEEAPVEDLFEHPQHPYTRALLSCIPDPEEESQNLSSIKGEMPDLLSPPAGCSFAPRCPRVHAPCLRQVPELFAIRPQHRVRCHLVAPEEACR